jgi:hypothetical protein
MTVPEENTAWKLKRLNSGMNHTFIAHPAQEKIAFARAEGKWRRDRKAADPHWIVMQRVQSHPEFAADTKPLRTSGCFFRRGKQLLMDAKFLLDIPLVQG